jgi:hypothetical protein
VRSPLSHKELAQLKRNDITVNESNLELSAILKLPVTSRIAEIAEEPSSTLHKRNVTFSEM